MYRFVCKDFSPGYLILRVVNPVNPVVFLEDFHALRARPAKPYFALVDSGYIEVTKRLGSNP